MNNCIDRNILLDMPIETVRQVKEFLRELRNFEIDYTADAEIKNKEREAIRFWKTGCRTRQTDISYFVIDKKLEEIIGNCYKVIYLGDFIGYTFQNKKGWVFIESEDDLINKELNAYKMRKIAVDRYIQGK